MSSGITRGDIFYIESYPQTGSEQRAGRPAIIVSNDMNNEFSATVEVVYLTTQPKTNLPTHVTIKSTSRTSTALCEQITSISRDRVGNWCARVSDAEMVEIETAMAASLGMPFADEYVVAGAFETTETPARVEYIPPPDYETIKAERGLYKQLYESIFDRVVPAKKGKVVL